MDPETARWFLSTIAEVTATLVGLAIVAMVFIVGEMRKALSDLKSIDDYIDTYGDVTGTPTKFLFWQVFAVLIVVVMGITTILTAVIGLSEIGTDVDEGTVRNASLAFAVVAMTMMMFSVFTILVGYRGVAREADVFEKMFGGQKKVGERIRERAVVRQRIREAPNTEGADSNPVSASTDSKDAEEHSTDKAN